jgi:hypothetical protein
METLMNGATVVEGALMSLLLALWITWLALRGLFGLMPSAAHAIAPSKVQPRYFAGQRQNAITRGEAVARASACDQSLSGF